MYTIIFVVFSAHIVYMMLYIYIYILYKSSIVEGTSVSVRRKESGAGLVVSLVFDWFTIIILYIHRERYFFFVIFHFLVSFFPQHYFILNMEKMMC